MEGLRMFRFFRFPRKEIEDTKGTEITLADALYFLSSNFKFFGLSALVLSIIGVALVLLLPEQFEKQVDLTVRRVSSEPLGSSFRVEMEEASTKSLNAAVGHLQEEDLGSVDVLPRYDRDRPQAELTLRSRDRESLDGIDSSTVVGMLEGEFQEFFEPRLASAPEVWRAELERYIEEKREKELVRADERIEEATAAGESTRRIENLEERREAVLSDIASAESELEGLEQAQGELPRLASEMSSVEVLDESEVRQSSSLVQRIAFAVLVSLEAAAILTVVRGVIGKKPRA